jgi:DNA-binding FadR family transcriptional regulator
MLSSAEQTTAFIPLQRYEQVAARLRADVREGRVAPGERLAGERDLARRLGVGRASVREAIAALGVEGLLVTRPGAGSFVAVDAVDRVRAASSGASAGASPSDLLEARALLEPAVARLAATRARADTGTEALLAAMDDAERPEDPDVRAAWNTADRQFHRRLATLTDNPVLVALADQVAACMDQPLWQRLRDEAIAVPGRMRLHAAEHRLIYEAILDGEGDAAAFQAARHLHRVRRDMSLDPQET